MAGIRIDAEAKTNSARAELEQLNRKIGDVTKNARFSGTALDKVFGKRSNNLEKEADGATKSFKKMERKGTQSLRKVDKSVTKTSNGMSGLRNTVLAVGSAIAAIAATNAFNKVADDLTDLQNRLKLVENSMLGVFRAQEQLYKVSKDTRSELAQNVSLYVDLTKASDRMGVSQQATISNLRTLQQMAMLSGTSLDGLKAAFTQLGQGIASGALRGEELNSVMEQFKVLSFALQRELKMNAGELREFAATGGITTEIIFSTLRNNAAKTEEAFNRTEIKAEQGVAKLSKSIALFSGELNHALGTSRRFATKLVGMSDAIDRASSSVSDSVNNTMLDIQNFSRSFQVEDSAFRAAKLVYKYSDSIDDVAAATWRYRKVLYGLNQLQKYFKPGEVAEEISAASEQIGKLTTVGSGEFTYSVDVGTLKAARKEADSALTETLKSTALIGFEIGSVFATVSSKILGVVGDTRLAIRPLTNSVEKEIVKLFTVTEAKADRALRPFLRGLQAINDTLSVSRLGQNIERSFVDIFRSDSLITLKENLGNFNDELQSGPTRQWPVIFRSLEVAAYRVAIPFRDLGVELGLLENKFLFIRNTRFDKLLTTVKALGGAFVMLYKDIIQPNLRVLFTPLLVELKYFGKIFKDVLSDTFSESFGSKLANLIADVIVSAFRFLADIGTKIADSLFNKQSFTSKAVSVTKEALKGILALLKGFGATMAERLLDGFGMAFEKLSGKSIDKGLDNFKDKLKSITDIDFSFKALPSFDMEGIAEGSMDLYKRMVDRVQALTVKMTAVVPKMVKDFGRSVKAVFLDIYDKVVGNSYWPDMIDGVVDYTDNLGGALSKINRFGDRVSQAFMSIGERIANMFSSVGINVAGIFETIMTADYGRVFSVLSANLATAIGTGFALFSSNALLKIGSAGFLINLLSDAFNVDYEKVFGGIATFVGTIGGTVAAAFITGIKDAIDFMLAAIPAVMNGLISGLVNAITGGIPIISDLFGSLLEFATSNAVLTGMIIGSVAYMKYVKGQKLFQGIGNLLLGEAATKGPTKGKRPRGGGAVGYMAPFLPVGGLGGGGKMAGIIKSLGKSGLLAGAAFASSFAFESISFLESALVGIPLLINGLIGPARLGLIFRQSAAVLTQMLKGSFLASAVYAKSVYAGSFLADAIAPAAAGMSAVLSKAFGGGRRRRGPGVLGTFANDIANVGSDVMANIRKNRSKYVSGNISFARLIFGERLFALNDLKSAFSKMTGVFARKLAPLYDTVVNFGSRVFNVLGPNGVGGRVVSATISLARSSGRVIKAGLGIALDAFRSGFGLLARVATSKTGLIIGGLGLLFGSMGAFAGSDDTLSDISGELGRLIAVAAGVGVAVTGIGLLANAFKDFSVARNLVLKNASTSAIAAAAPGINSERLRNMRNGMTAGVATDYASRRTAVVGSEAAAGAAKAARAAGLAAAKARFAGFATALGSFRSSVMKVVAVVTPAFKLMGNVIYNSLSTALQLLGPAARVGFGAITELFGKITGSQGLVAGGAIGKAGAFSEIGELLKSFSGETFTDLANSISETIQNLGPALGVLMNDVIGGMVRIARAGLTGLRAAFLRIIAFIGTTTLILTGVGAAAGALSLWMFGPEGTFGEKIEYAIDKVQQLFGMEPSGGIARFAKIMDNINTGLAENENIKNIKFAAKTVDTGELTGQEFGRFQKYTGSIGKTVSQMDQLRFEQGGILDETQLRELNQAADKFARAISRLPQNEKSPLDVAIESTVRTLDYRDASFFRAVDRYFAGELTFDRVLSGDELLEALGGAAKAGRARREAVNSAGRGADHNLLPSVKPSVSRPFADLVTRFGEMTAVGSEFKAELVAGSSALSDFSRRGLINARETNSYVGALLELESATKKATDAQERLSRAPNDPKRKEVASQLLDDQIQAQFAVQKLTGTLINKGARKFAADMFELSFKSLVTNTKEATGASIKRDSILDLSSFNEISAITTGAIERQRGQLESGGTTTIFEDFDEKLTKAVEKRQQEFLVKFAEKQAFFGSNIKQLASAGGLDIGEDLLTGFAVAAANFDSVIQPALETALKSREAIKNLTSNDGPDKIKAAYEKAFADQGKALEALSQRDGFVTANMVMKQAGLDELSLKVGSALSKPVLENMKAAAKAVVNAQNKLVLAIQTGTPEEQRAAAQEVVNSKRTATRQGILTNLDAAKTLRATTIGAYERSRQVAAVFGTEIPEGVKTSVAKMREWNSLQIELNENRAELLKAGGDDQSILSTIASLKLQIESIGEVANTSGILSTLSKSGFDATIAGFNRLTTGAQKRLAVLAGSLDKLYAARDTKSLTGTDLTQNIKAEREALDKVRKELKGALYADSESFLSGLSRFGVDAAKTIAKVPAGVLKGLLNMGTELDVVKIELDKAIAAENWAEISDLILDRSTITSNAEQTAKVINSTLSKSLDSLRSTIDVDLSIEAIAKLPQDMQALFEKAGLAFEVAQDRLKDGFFTPAQASALSTLKKRFNGVVTVLMTANNALDSIANKASVGLGKMFEVISNGTDRISQDIVDFARIPSRIQDSLYSGATANDALAKISLSDNLPGNIAKIINDNAGQDAAKTLALITEEAGDRFRSLSSDNSKMGKLTGALEELIKVIRNDTAARQGKPAVTEDSSSEKSGSERVTADSLATQRVRIMEQNATDLDARIAGLTSSFSKVSLLSDELGLTIEALSDRSPAELTELTKRLEAIRAAQLRYNIAVTNNTDDVQDAKAHLESLNKSVGEFSARLLAAEKAGEAFNESLKGSFQSNLSDYIVTGNWSDFRDGIADAFTMGIIDNFSQGLTNALFSDVFKNVFKNMGEGAANLGNGSSIMGLFKTGGPDPDDPTAKFGGKVDATGGFFANLKAEFVEVGTFLNDNFFSHIGTAFKFLGQSISSMLKSLGSGGGVGGVDWLGKAIGIAGSFFGGGGEANSWASNTPGAAAGGLIVGAGTGTSDSIMTRLSNREFVVNAKATKSNLALLQSINQGKSFEGFAGGGLVGASNGPSYNSLPSERMKSNSGATQQVINLSITGDISRQTKSEIYKMLPSIAQGVNQQNREKGIR